MTASWIKGTIVMREVCAFEAKNKLSELLDLAERGEEIVITKHGREVARLVPPHRQYSVEEARAAIRRIRGAGGETRAQGHARRTEGMAR
jgi:prevent-host-death family protein